MNPPPSDSVQQNYCIHESDPMLLGGGSSNRIAHLTIKRWTKWYLNQSPWRLPWLEPCWKNQRSECIGLSQKQSPFLYTVVVFMGAFKAWSASSPREGQLGMKYQLPSPPYGAVGDQVPWPGRPSHPGPPGCYPGRFNDDDNKHKVHTSHTPK